MPEIYIHMSLVREKLLTFCGKVDVERMDSFKQTNKQLTSIQAQTPCQAQTACTMWQVVYYS